ncbi:MAG: serine/threonine protein kinase [Deltaproteobacteria bacterium]|nr:serine/threonine protein kinase [Deltaproteobacteria bacterium]
MGTTSHTGQILDGKYRILRRLGKGGMGAVYMGQHSMIGRHVAIKILHAELSADEEMVTRFYREAQAAAAIGHKSIIDVFDLGVTEDGEPYLVMEYLAGESLATLLKRSGPIDLGLVCAVIAPALLALSAAHRKQIVHRDLKPDNIFIVRPPEEEPSIKLIDFGISKFIRPDDQIRLTQTGAMLGTPVYMAPEQAMGEGEEDHRSDIYSMGVIMYEALTGRVPYIGTNFNSLLVKILNNDPSPPSEVHAEFPLKAEPLVMKAMARDPADRFQSAQEMVDALAEFDEYKGSEARLSSVPLDPSKTTFASGDLGSDAQTESLDLAGEVMAKISSETTPGQWATAQSTRAMLREKKRSRAPLVALALLLLASVALLAILRPWEPVFSDIPRGVPARDVPKTGVVPASEAEPEQPATVTITVTGFPDGAKISYEGAPVPINPFKVKRGEAIAPLKVEAPGHEPFSISLVPSEDRTIVAELVPLSELEDGDSKPKPSGKKADKGKRGGFKKGGRGAEFTEEFQ